MDHHSITPPPFHPGDFSDSLESDATVIGSASSSITPHPFPLGITTRELAHALRGEMLGHFLLQQYIGGGGMGVVFKALDTTLDRIVAVKVVASHRVDSEDLQRRFLVEAQSTARLDHPNIARVHYIGRDRGLPYIVF
jgi:serine/threonine-protein kinase